MNILINSYACGPNWGSEVGMGWHWVTALANHCQLYVITELGFKDDIEKKLPELNLKFQPKFYYVDIGDTGRTLFWKQGSFKFYKFYKAWQKKALLTANKIIKTENIDLIHQLNMIGFREPGYLWSILEKPYIIGPLGGIDNFPSSFMGYLPIKNRVFTFLKNNYSNFQFNYFKRFKNACHRASVIFTATNDGYNRLRHIHGLKVKLLNETGCESKPLTLTSKNFEGTLKILWVGRMEERKALDLALDSLARVNDSIDYTLTIVGDGPLESYYKKMIIDKNLTSKCDWKGRIPNDEVQQLMKESDLFLFTSLREGTPHVVTEALQNGLPVICHNACGHGSVVTETCGLKIEMVNPSESVTMFYNQIVKINQDRKLLKQLSEGALKRAEEISWDNKAKDMFKIYKSLV